MEQYSNVLTEFINTVNNDPIVVHVGYGKLVVSNETFTFHVNYHLMKDNSISTEYDDNDYQEDDELFDTMKYEFDFFNVNAVDNMTDAEEEFELSFDDIVMIQESIRVEMEENEDDSFDEFNNSLFDETENE